MSFGVAFTNGSEEGRDGHEAAGLIQSCHVERNPGNISARVIVKYVNIVKRRTESMSQTCHARDQAHRRRKLLLASWSESRRVVWTEVCESGSREEK